MALSNTANLTPSYLFETSWEVCNKVGGIHTVIATKALSMVNQLGDHYMVIGPDIHREDVNLEFEEDTELLKSWRQTLYNDGFRIKVGRWKIAGRPIAILVDFSQYVPKKDDVLKFLWESYRVDSISGQWDYIEPVLFGYAAAKVIESYVESFCASTDKVAVAAYQAKNEKLWGVQFHPEVFHTEDGTQLLKNFVVDICGGKQDWSAASFIETTVAALKEQLGDDKVVLGLSGGVDSSVAAVLLNKAIGKNLTCIFVDHGMLRKNEFKNVLHDYECLGLNVIGVDASEKFFAELAGVTEPERKRKIIGKGFIDVFDEEAHKISDVKWLAQGTIYPDCIESLSITGTVIKSHHNVGGLPEKMNLKLCEPLRLLFKDEVRRVGRELGMPEHLITRHPFPGPGLAVRILGDITREKVRILQDADDIFIQGLRDWKTKDAEGKETALYDQVWQAGVILLPVQSVGVMGDERTYERAVALRAVTSTDAMTADWAHLPYEFMAKVSNDIINKVKGVNRVCYDISSKPPATIEWE